MADVYSAWDSCEGVPAVQQIPAILGLVSAATCAGGRPTDNIESILPLGAGYRSPLDRHGRESSSIAGSGAWALLVGRHKPVVEDQSGANISNAYRGQRSNIRRGPRGGTHAWVNRRNASMERFLNNCSEGVWASHNPSQRWKAVDNRMLPNGQQLATSQAVPHHPSILEVHHREKQCAVLGRANERNFGGVRGCTEGNSGSMEEDSIGASALSPQRDKPQLLHRTFSMPSLRSSDKGLLTEEDLAEALIPRQQAWARHQASGRAVSSGAEGPSQSDEDLIRALGEGPASRVGEHCPLLGAPVQNDSTKETADVARAMSQEVAEDSEIETSFVPKMSVGSQKHRLTTLLQRTFSGWSLVPKKFLLLLLTCWAVYLALQVCCLFCGC